MRSKGQKHPIRTAHTSKRANVLTWSKSFRLLLQEKEEEEEEVEEKEERNTDEWGIKESWDRASKNSVVSVLET